MSADSRVRPLTEDGTTEILSDANAITKHVDRWLGPSLPGGVYHSIIRLADLPNPVPTPAVLAESARAQLHMTNHQKAQHNKLQILQLLGSDADNAPERVRAAREQKLRVKSGLDKVDKEMELVQRYKRSHGIVDEPEAKDGPRLPLQSKTNTPPPLSSPIQMWTSHKPTSVSIDLCESPPQSPPPPRKQIKRRLPKPSKLTDDKLNMDWFRMYVQEWLKDKCAREAGSGQPPIFHPRYLRRVPRLRSVAALTAKKRFKEAAQRNPGAVPPRSGSMRRIVHRAFDWVVRELWKIGFIVHAGSAGVEGLKAPFDGRKKPSEQSQSVSMTSVTWGGTAADLFSSDAEDSGSYSYKRRRLQTDIPPSSGQSASVTGDACEEDLDGMSTDSEVDREPPSAHVELWQLVTPALLHAALLPLRRGSAEPRELLKRLQNTDMRWQHVQLDSVAEAINFSQRNT